MSENSISIGRSPNNDIVIKDDTVSGFHAQLIVSAEGTYHINDANSSNGTFVMQQGQLKKVTGPVRVGPEDEITMGNTRLSTSQLLSKAPPHLLALPAMNQNDDYLNNRTRPIQQHQEVFQGRNLQLTPEHAAIESLNYPRQQVASRVAMGSPVPEEERVIWSGYSSLSYWILGMLWSGIWVIIWLILAFVITLPFLALALVAAIGVVRKILFYINTFYEFTSQRVRRRTGVLTIRRNQIELFRLKDFEVVETMWGRLFNYSHIRLISSDRIMPHALFLAIPNGAELAEKMRRMAQVNRAESGIMHLKE